MKGKSREKQKSAFGLEDCYTQAFNHRIVVEKMTQRLFTCTNGDSIMALVKSENSQ